MLSGGQESLLWSGILHEGASFNLSQRQLVSEITDANPVWNGSNFDVLEDDIKQKAYLTVQSTKPVSVTVRPPFDSSSYAHGDFVPDRWGSGAGIDLIGYCVPAMGWVFDDEQFEYIYVSLQRYFTILSHNDNTQFSIYNPVTWEPVDFNPDVNDIDIVLSLNEGQHFKAQDYLADGDKNWRVVSTKPVTVSTGANRAFAEYAPLAGIHPPTPMIEMTARTESGYPDTCSDPNVYPQDPAADEVTYTITCWNPSAAPMYGQKIIDELPDQVDRDFVQFTGLNSSYDSGSNTITWDIGTLASEQDVDNPVLVTVTVRIDQYPENCDKIVNRARIENVAGYTATLPVLVQVDMTGLPPIGDIIYVDGHATGLNNGSSWQDAFNDLQKALQIAPDSSASQIWVAKGIYSPGPLVTSTFQMIDYVNMYGGFAGTETNSAQRDLLDPNNRTILTGYLCNDDVVTAATAILDGFTIQEGCKHGVYCEGDAPVIQNCIIQNNIIFEGYAGYLEINGDGIYCEYGSPIISNNIICENGFSGICLTYTSNARVENNRIVNNEKGAYLYNLSGTTTIRNNTIVNNDDYAIYHSDPSAGQYVDIFNCIIWGKSDFDFDILYGTADDTLIYNCLSDPNTVDWTIIDPNFAEPNSTSHSIFENYYLYSEKTTNVSDANYICVADGTRYRLNEKIEIEDDGILRTITRITEGVDYDIVDFIPVCVGYIPEEASIYKWGTDAASAIEDCHIKAGSRCINKGSTAGIGLDEVDMDGQPRIMGGDPNGAPRVDIGADEFATVIAGRYTIQILQSTNYVDLSLANAHSVGGQEQFVWSLMDGPTEISFVNPTTPAYLCPTVHFTCPGVYTLKIEAFDTLDNSTGYDITTIIVHLDMDAGPYRDIFLANGSWDETLTGTIVGGAADHVLWEKVSGPDGLAISSPDALQTSAVFTMAGYYTLRLSAYDEFDTLIGSDEVAITVYPSSLFVEAGSDQEAQLNTAGTAQAVLDDAWYISSASGIDAIEYWELVDNNKPVDFTVNARGIWTATFSQTGVYVLAYVVTEDGGQTEMDTLTVSVWSDEIPLTVSAGQDLYEVLDNGTATVQTEQAFVYPDDNVTIQWYDQNNDPISGATSGDAAFTLSQSEVYEYTLKATRGSETVEDKVTITIFPQLAEEDLIILTGEYEPVLAGEPFVLDGAFVSYGGSGILTCRWSSNDESGVTFNCSDDGGITSTALKPTVEFLEGVEKTYTLTLTVYNDLVEIGSASVSIRAVTETTETPQDTVSPVIILTSSLLDDYGNAFALPETAIKTGTVLLEIYLLDALSGLDTVTVEDTLNGTTTT